MNSPKNSINTFFIVWVVLDTVVEGLVAITVPRGVTEMLCDGVQGERVGLAGVGNVANQRFESGGTDTAAGAFQNDVRQCNKVFGFVEFQARLGFDVLYG